MRVRGTVAAVLVLSAACTHRPCEPEAAPMGWTQRGLASWYGKPFHGRRTASGEVYDMHQLTAAHRSLPFATRVRVKRRDTGAEVTVRINDRGPFVRGRIIDLSLAAARRIGLDVDGVAPVVIRVVGSERAVEEYQPPPAGGAGDTGATVCLWVQVGAFGDEGNAGRARKRLRGAGEEAVVMEGPGGLHRVRVGPFSERDDAEQALERLRRKYPPSRIVECGT